MNYSLNERIICLMMNTSAFLLLAIKPGLIVLIVVLVLIIAGAIALYFLGKKAQKKQAEQQALQVPCARYTVPQALVTPYSHRSIFL